jgi:hypothetical protein
MRRSSIKDLDTWTASQWIALAACLMAAATATVALMS